MTMTDMEPCAREPFSFCGKKKKRYQSLRPESNGRPMDFNIQATVHRSTNWATESYLLNGDDYTIIYFVLGTFMELYKKTI